MAGAVCAVTLLSKKPKAPETTSINTVATITVSDTKKLAETTKKETEKVDSETTSATKAAESAVATATLPPTTESEKTQLQEPQHYSEENPHAKVDCESTGLNLRYGPSTKYAVILEIPNKSAVVEYGYNDDGDWVYVKYNGKFGWVSVEYIKYDNYTAAKPVIYLYPEQKTDVSVKLMLKNAEFTCTYPKYNSGWNVTAYLGGKIINKADNNEYSYLYWEASSKAKLDFSQGFTVKGSDTAEFLREKLSYMGLTPKEYNEFIVYWLPLMQDNEYNLISFQGANYTDMAQLQISPKPDSMLRVYMAYKPLNEYKYVPEQKLEKFNRTGFCLVEWGGCEVK